jgi:hypothetical protein
MRGKILQYNGNEGTGIIMADGRQLKFNISIWRSDIAPTVGKTVDVALEGGEVQTVSVVGDDVLLREKTAELTGRLGGVVGGLGERLNTPGGMTAPGGAVGSIITRYGVPLLAAFAVFLISSLAFDAITMQIFGVSDGQSLFDLSTALDNTGGGGGGVKPLLVLGYLSIAVPILWADKRGWLAMLIPLLAVLWGMWSVRSATSAAGPLGDVFSYGLGMYLSLIAAIAIAVIAVQRYRTA